ncbi:MAG: hypothetical protein ACKOA8_06450 [Deltaproteobacteria bacterium]
MKTRAQVYLWLFFGAIYSVDWEPICRVTRTPNEHALSEQGRSEGDPERDWSFWGQIRMKDVAIKYSGEKCRFARSVLAQSLEKIPSIELEEVAYKSSQVNLPVQCSSFTLAESARYSLRLNLSSIKAQIVGDVLKLFKATPPKPFPDVSSELEIANDFADAYIAIVDKFLKEHPGARPKLGKRIEFLGLQNEINAPWCADWAQGVLEGFMNRFDAKHPIQKWLKFQWAQIRSPQHNFVVIYPSGRPPAVPPKPNDHTLLIADPWHTILPGTYFPGDVSWAGGKVPTNLGIE